MEDDSEGDDGIAKWCERKKKECDLNAQLRTHHANTSCAINKNTTMRTKLTNLSKMTT